METGAYLDISEGGIEDFVVFRKTVNLPIVHVNEHVVVFLYAMLTRVGVESSALEVFAADEAAVDVGSRKRY